MYDPRARGPFHPRRFSFAAAITGASSRTGAGVKGRLGLRYAGLLVVGVAVLSGACGKGDSERDPPTATPPGFTVTASVAGAGSPTAAASDTPSATGTSPASRLTPGTLVCPAGVRQDICTFAARTTSSIQLLDLEAVFAGAQPTEYTCAADGNVQGFEYSDLCRGATDGATREGFPLALHGSEGGPVSEDSLADRLRTLFVPAGGRGPALASIGCPTSSGECDTFILAYATRKQPAAAYLVFRGASGQQPALIGAGISGDNAGTILDGGLTVTSFGETRFAPVGAPGP